MNAISASSFSRNFPIHDAIDLELHTLYERVRPSVVQVRGGAGHAAGTIWRTDGLIVTNDHVVGKSNRLQIVLDTGRTIEGQVVARDSHKDLALVEIQANELRAADIGDSTRIRPGQLVISIGHPHGAVNTLTFGIVVASGQIVTKNGPRARNLVQTDARIAPGSSGGPLLGANGRVLGINCRVDGRLSLAVPSATVERFVAGLVPTVAQAFLGIDGIVANSSPDVESAGLVVTEVVVGSPADRAGSMVGDVIRSIAGIPILDRESVAVAMLRVQPGEQISIDFLRGGRSHQIVIIPIERVQESQSRAY